MDDITDTLAPKSDQLDAIDLLTGPRTFTITRVSIKENPDQPADIHLAEFERPWRPNKNTRRVLAKIWGSSKNGAYEGRMVTLWRDPDVEWGGKKVGGIRVTHASHIDGPVSVPLQVKRGVISHYTVEPLTEADVLRAEWHLATPERRAEIEALMKGGQS